MTRCLYCYQLLDEGQLDFHEACSRKMFGKAQPPLLPYTEEQMLELGQQVIKSQVAVTGVQPKLSLDIQTSSSSNAKRRLPVRFTIVGLWGSFILKPEIEDLTMHLATATGISTVPHSLIRLRNGRLAYITRRIDRVKKTKLHMEDMCQLTGRLTEDKYKGSYEQIGKAILAYSENPVLDLVNFFEQVIFSFLTGNADMHLKNFSLIKGLRTGYVLAPAYDLVASALIVPGDTEELALNLNGKKRKIDRRDFDASLSSFRVLDDRTIENIYRKFADTIPQWPQWIENSFVPEELKNGYKELIGNRASKLSIG
jgi:serine/threonine-protein kinase HipA